MGPKKGPKSFSDYKSSTFGESDDMCITPRLVSVSVTLEGEYPGPGEGNFLTLFNGQVVLEGKWQDKLILETEALPLNLKDPYYQQLAADKPLIFIIRAIGGKGAKDPDPLLNVDNRAGASVDLCPLIMGENLVYTRVDLVLITTGENIGCAVTVRAEAFGALDNVRMPLQLTMISAHCLPVVKEGTVYLGAIGLDGVTDPVAINFGMSLSSCSAKKLVWASASNGGYAANTAYNVHDQDKFIPEDFEPKDTHNCNSVYWNAITRIIVDPFLLREKLSSPFLIEIAGVPRMGKIEVRGRYMGFLDAGVLLEPGQMGVSACTKLLFYNETMLPENVSPLLELPPTSAKVSARDTDLIMDEYGHNAYVTIRFDLMEPLVQKTKILALFDILGFPLREGPVTSVDELYVDPPPEDHSVDVRRIRKEGGALAVHKEISSLACKGAVPMNQSIKRTAANRLLMRVRSMLKQFSPGNCSYIEWQDTVTSQHAASKRAVTSSFAPQPPPLRLPALNAACRCRMAADSRIAEIHNETYQKVIPLHPGTLLSKALGLLEQRFDSEARTYILQGLNVQMRNRYLLWIFGAQEFDKGDASLAKAAAAFRIAVKGDISDGTTHAIGWAALHAIYHYSEKEHAAFVAAKLMRKSYELPREWRKFLQRWVKNSGEEEVFWIPAVVDTSNPMLICAAFFLCLRCYKLSEQLLKCVEHGCSTRGSRLGLKSKVTYDVYYLRAASLLLRRQLDKALETTQNAIKRFGPAAITLQMQTICLMCINGWNGDCEDAFILSENCGAEPCPALLIQAALGGFKSNPNVALQRAARAHKIAHCGHTAIIIGRIYLKMGETNLAKRWACVAVKLEPLLADGWAVLAIIAMQENDKDKARVMIRTARQAGPISKDVEVEMKKLMDIIKAEKLSDAMVKNLCLCDYYVD